MKKSFKIIAYPGRFQPFGPHHFKIYKNLCEKFGVDNVYIVTSNSVNENSPLSFDEKKMVIEKFGISPEKIVYCKSPYKPVELLQKFDKDSYSLIIAQGEKDKDRIQFIKKDGTSSYYKRYYGQNDLDSHSNSGYVYLYPYLKMNYQNNEICSSYLRKILPFVSDPEFEAIMGWYDEDIHHLISKKFAPNSFNSFHMMPNTQRYTKHIQHPYECSDLTFSELSQFIVDCFSGDLLASPKIDGMNLQMTFKDGKVLAARNKTTVLNPMSMEQLENKFEIDYLKKNFTDAFRVIELMMTGYDFGLDLNMFDNGRTFLNFEIVCPPYNVYSYPEKMIVLHNLISYDGVGNKTKTSGINFQYPEKVNEFVITDSKPIRLKIKDGQTISKKFLEQLNQIRNSDGLGEDDRIGSSNSPSRLQFLILSLGNHIISNHYKPYTEYQKNDLNLIIQRLEKIIDDIYNDSDPKLKDKLEHEIKRLSFLGGYQSINPVEGFVFDWKGRQFKLTGSFAPTNQILALLRYKK